MKKALFRLDSGGRFGLGHIMRSKALADALLEIDIDCTFAVRKIHSDDFVNPHHLAHINDEQHFIIMARHYNIIIVDHYDYTSELFFQLSKYQKSTLVILDDECNRGNLYADMVINPIAQAVTLPYKKVAAQAQLLIGPEYILLKKAFQQLQFKAFELRDTIVVTFGGSDVTGLTMPVLSVIKDSTLMRFKIIVVTGAGYNNIDEIHGYCLEQNFEHQHDVKNMANIFSRAFLAISAAGSTSFELAFCGVPAVFAVVADNQLLSTREQCHHGWCDFIDCRTRNQPEELVLRAEKMIDSMPLETMSQTARSFVDAKGAARVAAAINHLT